MVETKAWETWVIPDLDDSKKKLPEDLVDKDSSTSNIELGEHEAIEDVEDWGEESQESVEEVDSTLVQLPSAEELEELRKKIELEAYGEGFEKGRSHGEESGYKEAHEQAKQDISSAVTLLTQMANSLINPLEDQDQAIEQILLNSVLTIAKSVVSKELTAEPDQILSVVKQAVDALPQSEKQIKIHIHPSDAELIQQHAEEHESWTLCTNDEVSPGGCKIETANSLVDATVESRLQIAIDQFLGKELSTGQSEQSRLIDPTDSSTSSETAESTDKDD